MRRFIPVLALLFLSPCLPGQSQQYSVDWYKVSGGGGTSSGGQYAVIGTVGQPDAGGPMTGGNYSLTGGFWSLIAAVQSPAAPTLYIARSSGQVVVYWQNLPGWALQQNGTLTLPAGWSAASGVTTSNGTNYLNITQPSGQMFYRLIK